MGWYPCCCAGCPAYEASSGNEETDDFSGTFDWTVGGGLDTWANVAGLLRLTTDGDVDGGGSVYQTFTVTDETDLVIIAEVEVYPYDSNTISQALIIRVDDTASPVDEVRLSSPWDGSDYITQVSYGGTTVSNSSTGVTPSDGDKLTIRIDHQGGGVFRVCFYVNESEIDTVDVPSSWDFEVGNNLYVLSVNYTSSTPAGEFDNFTIQKDE